MSTVIQHRNFFTCPAHEVEVGDRLLKGTVAFIRGAASPKGSVEFTFDDGTTELYGWAGTVIVLTGEVVTA